MTMPSETMQAIDRALRRQCPVCRRAEGHACVIPEGSNLNGVFIHHERIARGKPSRTLTWKASK